MGKPETLDSFYCNYRTSFFFFFFVMKLIKTKLRNRMEDEFLADHIVVYIEKEIDKNFTLEMIMNKFYSISDRR